MTGLPAVAAKHVGMFVLWWKSRVYKDSITTVVLPLSALMADQLSGLKEREPSATLTSVRDSGERADENLTMKAWPRPMFVQDVQASCLHTQKLL